VAPPRSVRFVVAPPISNRDLNELYRDAWPRHRTFDFRPILDRSLAYVGAFQAGELVGFVYLAWDGGQHAFLLEPTVATRLRRRGVGSELVRRAVREARRRRLDWVHVDFGRRLTPFYRACGFVPTPAGLVDLRAVQRRQ
jgi:GNAT superfamily N-acetyltransferase